jgi:hypothetical protein
MKETLTFLSPVGNPEEKLSIYSLIIGVKYAYRILEYNIPSTHVVKPRSTTLIIGIN